ncbi:MAG: M2 family metallopeptidase, partial [Acidobacteria bacterium]|nr:M2 family metallopeptidase [Acidobacteriota bacterium]
LRLSNEANQAGWVQNTYITSDTEAMAARANAAYATAVTDFAKRAAQFDAVELAPDERRQLNVLRTSLTMAAPADPKEAAELAQLVASMEGTYGRGKYCQDGESDEACLDIEEITEIMAKDRNPARLLDVWEGWHAIAPPMKDSYARFVELSNKGARELGFADTAAMWRSRYDMPPEAFPQELDRLWGQLQPLYLSLHAYVRTKLRARYGDQVPADGPIPAHLLGNIWAQDWSNLYDLVAPSSGASAVNLTNVLRARNIGPLEMTRYAERFFTSLGFDPLPPTFWERSMFVKPRDREVVCHASAWNVDNVDDLRFKMCIDQTAEDFTVIHHELGHNFYARAYAGQPPIVRDSANDGFHEAIGDTIAISVTPEYLVKVGLIPRAPDASGDIGLLLRTALERLAFLPFGLVVDSWRWQVFDGSVTPDRYNQAWWELRERYQGVRPASTRGEEFFDPGAKYHIPANTPYARYFLSAVLQFQFHRALSQTAGCTTPLHRCSIYGSAEAGKRLKAALEMGASRPWPEVLEALTGQREMDASAMADYYAPLKAWLDEQNTGQKLGW